MPRTRRAWPCCRAIAAVTSSCTALARAAACCRVPVGATGLLLGLVGGAQYNGSQVRVQGIDAATGRYEVELGGQFSGKHLKVKRANLRV